MKKCQFMLGLFTVFFTISEILTFIPLAAGQYGPYLGNSNANNPPSFVFSLENGTEIYTAGKYNVGFYVMTGAPLNSMYLPGGGIYSISYKASWEYKRNVIFEWSINDPTNMSDDDPNARSSFFYAIELSDAPEGSNKIEIFVEGGGYLFAGSGYTTFSTNGSTSFHFSVIAPPSPTVSPEPGNLSSVWDIQTIDTMGAGAYVYRSPLVVLDSNDVPHIAYSKLVDFPNSPIRFVVYSSWNGFDWTSQSVGIGTPYGFVLDENATPHLAFGFLANIAYATFNGTNWCTQTIDNTGGGVGRVAGTIALDSSGQPHVAYSRDNMVKYACRTGQNWNIQTVDLVDFEYTYPFQLSLALDQNDMPYILYGYPPSEENRTSPGGFYTEVIEFVVIKLAIYKNSNWSIETIPLSSPINGYGNMVLDSNDNPHFICSQLQLPSTGSTLSDVLYVNWNGTAWNTQVVVSNVTLGIYSESRNWINMGYLALDSYDYPKINYINNSTLTYAGWNGNSWDITTIDTNPQSNKPGALALDSNNNPHISYIGPRAHTNWLTYSYSEVRYATSSEVNGNVTEPEQPTEPETPTETEQPTKPETPTTPEEPTTSEEPEPEPTETPLITTEAAIVITAAVTAIISLTVYWFVRKRQ